MCAWACAYIRATKCGCVWESVGVSWASWVYWESIGGKVLVCLGWLLVGEYWWESIGGRLLVGDYWWETIGERMLVGEYWWETIGLSCVAIGVS